MTVATELQTAEHLGPSIVLPRYVGKSHTKIYESTSVIDFLALGTHATCPGVLILGPRDSEKCDLQCL